MMLVIFLALIANSALGSDTSEDELLDLGYDASEIGPYDLGSCNLGRPRLKNFDWDKVGFIALTCLL